MKEYRDDELGTLVARADDPAPVDPGLEARVWGRLAEQPRRRKWPWVLLVLVIALMVGAVLWRWVPPSGGTMNDIRTLVFSRQMAEQPQPPAGAKPGKALTKEQRAAVERMTRQRLGQVLTPREYTRAADHAQIPRVIAGALSRQVAHAHRFPIVWGSMGAGEQLGDLSFVRRNPSGSLVVRVVHWDQTLWSGSNGPHYTQEYTLQKLDGSWRIAAERDLGLWPDGALSEDLGG